MLKTETKIKQGLIGSLQLLLIILIIFFVLFGIIPTFGLYSSFSNLLGLTVEKFSIFLSSVAGVAFAVVGLFALAISKDMWLYQHMYPKLIVRQRSTDASAEIIIKNTGSDSAFNIEVQISHPLIGEGFTYTIDILESNEEQVITHDELNGLLTYPVKIGGLSFKLKFLNYKGVCFTKDYLLDIPAKPQK